MLNLSHIPYAFPEFVKYVSVLVSTRWAFNFWAIITSDDTPNLNMAEFEENVYGTFWPFICFFFIFHIATFIVFAPFFTDIEINKRRENIALVQTSWHNVGACYITNNKIVKLIVVATPSWTFYSNLFHALFQAYQDYKDVKLIIIKDIPALTNLFSKVMLVQTFFNSHYRLCHLKPKMKMLYHFAACASKMEN